MNYKVSMELINRYADCPKCGNEHIGNGQGGLIVDDDIFKRWCKCGFEIIINEKEYIYLESLK